MGLKKIKLPICCSPMWTTKGSFGKYYNLAKCLWGILVVIAILSRAVIPDGMMPDFQSQTQGIFKLTICSGDGMKTIDVPAGDYNPAGTPQPTHRSEPCSYAVGLSTANLVLAVLIILFIEVLKVLFIGPPILRRESKPLFTPIHPRAPPCFS